MKLIRSNKKYISKEEAKIICLKNKHELPKRNQEILHSRGIGLQNDVIGHEKNQYYIENVEVKGLILI